MQSSVGGERKLYVEIKENNNTFSEKSLFQQNETRERRKKSMQKKKL